VRRPGVAPTLYRPAITLTLRRRVIARALRPPTVAFRVLLSHAMVGAKLAAGAAAAAMVALAIMNYQDGEPAVSGSESANNETVVYRRAAPARLQSANQLAISTCGSNHPLCQSRSASLHYRGGA